MAVEDNFFIARFDPYTGPLQPKQPCQLMETRACMSVTKNDKDEVVKTEFKNSVCKDFCERFDQEL